MAAAKGRFQMVGYLADQKADINFKDKHGVSGTVLLNLVILIWLTILTDSLTDVSIRVLCPSFCCLKEEPVSIQTPKLLVIPTNFVMQT